MFHYTFVRSFLVVRLMLIQEPLYLELFLHPQKEDKNIFLVDACC